MVLVVAMGIGQFSFTPQVSLTIRDGELTLLAANALLHGAVCFVIGVLLVWRCHEKRL